MKGAFYKKLKHDPGVVFIHSHLVISSKINDEIETHD